MENTSPTYRHSHSDLRNNRSSDIFGDLQCEENNSSLTQNMTFFILWKPRLQTNDCWKVMRWDAAKPNKMWVEPWTLSGLRLRSACMCCDANKWAVTMALPFKYVQRQAALKVWGSCQVSVGLSVKMQLHKARHDVWSRYVYWFRLKKLWVTYNLLVRQVCREILRRQSEKLNII